jgi:hypothetical protein
MKNNSKISIFALAGCILFVCCANNVYSQKSFVDTLYHKADFEAIQKLVPPVPVKVNVEFQRNGKHLPAVDKVLQGEVESSLISAGVFKPSKETNVLITISVTGNNIADLKAARSKGFKTGLTFGAAGSMIDDNYEFLIVYSDGSGKEQKYTYQHAIHTWVGKKMPQTSLEPTTVTKAFNRVVEDIILNFLKDLQDAGLTPKQ